MIRSVKAMEQELVKKVMEKDLNVRFLEYREYKAGSMYFLGIDKEEGIETVIRLDTFNFNLYQKWVNNKELEFHIGSLS